MFTVIFEDASGVANEAGGAVVEDSVDDVGVLGVAGTASIPKVDTSGVLDTEGIAEADEAGRAKLKETWV